MDLLGLLLLIAIVGVVVWAIVTYLPMPQPFKTIIIVVACIGILILLYNVFGGYLPHLRVGK